MVEILRRYAQAVRKRGAGGDGMSAGFYPTLGGGGLETHPTVRTGLSQAEFARFIGVQKATLLNWESRRRKPDGPARVLLALIAKEPGIVQQVWGEGCVGWVLARHGETFERIWRGEPRPTQGNRVWDLT